MGDQGKLAEVGSIYEQQLGPVTAAGWLTLTESGAAEGVAPTASACESMSRALISLNKCTGLINGGSKKRFWGMTHRARVKNASSTPSLIFADVSMNLTPSSSASSRPWSSETALLSAQSDLLPMRILFTPSEACCSMFACQVRMSTSIISRRVGRWKV